MTSEKTSSSKPFGGYSSYDEAIHIAYEHFNKTTHAYKKDEDFSSVTLEDIKSNETLLNAFKDRYIRLAGKRCIEPAVFRALADRNRTMIEYLAPPHRMRLSKKEFKSLSFQDNLPAIARLQNRSIEEVTQQFDEALGKGKSLTAAFAHVLLTKSLSGVVTGLDLETTALYPERGYIINVGWEQIELTKNSQPMSIHSQMAGLPEWYEITGIPASQTHHITWDNLDQSTPFREDKQLQETLLASLKEYPCIAHNACFEDEWLTIHLDGYAEARAAGEIIILDSISISKALEGNQQSNGGHKLNAWGHRLGILSEDEEERHLGLEDTDLMLRCVMEQLDRSNLLS